MNVGVAILRLQEGLDCSEILADIDDLIRKTPKEKIRTRQDGYEFSITRRDSNMSSHQYSTTDNSPSGLTDMEVVDESEMTIHVETRRTVVLGVTKNKKSKKSKKQAVTFRYVR